MAQPQRKINTNPTDPGALVVNEQVKGIPAAEMLRRCPAPLPCRPCWTTPAAAAS